MHTTDLCSVCKGIQQIFIQDAKVIQNFVSGMQWLSTILNSECKGIQQFFVQDVKIQSWEFAHSLIAISRATLSKLLRSLMTNERP